MVIAVNLWSHYGEFLLGTPPEGGWDAFMELIWHDELVRFLITRLILQFSFNMMCELTDF